MKNQTITPAERIANDLQSCNLILCFEITVIDKRTNKYDFFLFDIVIPDKGDTALIAHHSALTKEQEESAKIAFVSVDIDDVFTTDEHLNDLHDECINAIIDSDFYELAN